MSKVLMALAIVFILLAMAMGVAVAYVLTKGPPEPVQQGAEATDGAGEQGEGLGGYEFIPFGSTVVNLAGGRLTRYLQVAITLKVSKDAADAVRGQLEEGPKAVLKNWLLVHLSDKRIEDVEGGAAMQKLRREIEDGFNSILIENAGCKVDEVLFDEFNVQ